MMNNNHNNRNNFKQNNPWDLPANYAYSYRGQNIQENLVNNQNSWRTHQRPFHRQNTEMQKEKNFPIFGQRPSVPYNENNLNTRNTVNFSNCFYQLDHSSNSVPKDIENEQFSSDMEFSQQEERKKRIRVKAVYLPKRGQPGGLDDPLRKGLSGAGVRWYLRYLAEGNTPHRAKKLAMARKTTVQNIQNDNGIEETKKRNRENVISEKKPDHVKRIKTVPNNQETSELDPNEFQEIVYGIQIQILAKDDKKLLNEKDLNELENSIIDEVAKGWDTKIIFSGINFNSGILSIICANEETANWLIERTPQLTTWKGIDLIVRKGEELPKPKFVTIFFPKSKKENIDKALELLEAQNSEISTGSWKIINTTEINSGLIVNVIIDGKSIEIMEKSEYNLNYRFGKIKIKVNKNQTLFPVDQNLITENKVEGTIECNRSSPNSKFELEMKEKVPDSNSKELKI